MIKNSAKWKLANAPNRLIKLIEMIQESNPIAESAMHNQGAYAIQNKDLDTGDLQIHIGYFLPEIASQFSSEENFRQEFFISVRSVDGEPDLTILYHTDIMEIPPSGEGFKQTIIDIDEDLLLDVSDELQSSGFLNVQTVEDYVSHSNSTASTSSLD